MAFVVLLAHAPPSPIGRPRRAVVPLGALLLPLSLVRDALGRRRECDRLPAGGRLRLPDLLVRAPLRRGRPRAASGQTAAAPVSLTVRQRFHEQQREVRPDLLAEPLER